jgi:hypothetical protein
VVVVMGVRHAFTTPSHSPRRRFLEHDLPLFKGIVSDLFPGVDVPFVDYGRLQSAIEEQLELAGLQKVPTLITKIIQTHETQLVRHGMMLVGEAGSGKTVNQDVLAKALSQLKREGVTDKDGFYQQVQRFILNPKAVTMGDLYGEFNLMTQVSTLAGGGGGRGLQLCSDPPSLPPSPRPAPVRLRRSGATAWWRRWCARRCWIAPPTASGSCSMGPWTRCGSRT